MRINNTMKPVFLLSLVLFILLLSGCDQNLTDNPPIGETNGRVIGSISGIVAKANTNSRLANIEVTWGVAGQIKSTTTNSLGHYSITDLSPGDYEISFSGANYAMRKMTVTIPNLQQIGIVDMPTEDDFYYNATQNAILYDFTSQLTGKVYARQDAQNIILANEVTIVADFGAYDISPSQFTTITDSTGTFTFDSLPATDTVDLRTLPYYNGSNSFGVQTGSANLIANGTADAGTMILSIAPATPFIVQNNFENDTFGLTQDILITFSKKMEPASFNINLYNDTYGAVDLEATWSDDVTLSIHPYIALQANETYYLELNGVSQDHNNYSANLDFTTRRGIKYFRTNLERIHGIFDEFPIDSDIEITFNMPVDLSNFNGYARLRDASNTLVSTSLSTSTDSLILIIHPQYDLEPGMNYSLAWVAYSTIPGDFESDLFQFTTAQDISLPGEVNGFTINMGELWAANWNTTNISFKWSSLANVDGYLIYARDNKKNSDLILVGSYGAQEFSTTVTGSVYLGNFPQFDLYANDGFQSPFTGGSQLTFKISAYNDAGEGGFSDSIVVADETIPSGSLYQDISADNSSYPYPRLVSVDFSASEYMDATLPTVGFIETGGDTTFVLSNSAVTFDWDSDMRGGVFTITVPDSTDASGDNFFITGFQDNSGNLSSDSLSIILQ